MLCTKPRKGLQSEEILSQICPDCPLSALLFPGEWKSLYGVGWGELWLSWNVMLLGLKTMNEHFKKGWMLYHLATFSSPVVQDELVWPITPMVTSHTPETSQHYSLLLSSSHSHQFPPALLLIDFSQGLKVDYELTTNKTEHSRASALGL